MSSLFGIGGGGNVGAAGGFYSYSIDQSLRFDRASSARLMLDPIGSPTGSTKCTISFWIKRTTLGASQYLFTGEQSNIYYDHFQFNPSDQLQIIGQENASSYGYRTNAVFRDVGAWYHVVLECDSTLATGTDRYKVYVNNVQQTLTSIYGVHPQNHAWYWNKSGNSQNIGRSENYSNYYGGYMAEFNFIDGQALDPTSFGETINGIWVPKQYSGSYGTNGFYLSFADSAAIGDDLSGNTNDFTATNLAASDVVTDSPTNNFATFNPLDISGTTLTYSEGNLKAERTTTSFAQAYSSFSFDSGKWYAEFLLDTGNTGVGVIAGTTNPAANRYIGQDTYTYGFHYDGRKVNSASYTAYGSAYTRAADGSGDVVGVYIDADNGDIYFSVNGTVQNSGTAAFTGVTGPFRFAIGSESNAFHIANFGQDDSFAGLKTSGSAAASDDNGNGVFYDAIGLSGYLAPCTANLPEPTIGPNSTTTSDQHFNAVLYTGTGATQSITGVGFQPDLVWVKRRTGIQEPSVTDSVRGVNAQLRPAATNVESAQTDALTSFDADGFTLGADATNNSYNYYTDAHVAWNWKAGGTAVSNTDGSITSSVSANPDAGFSIVSFTCGSGVTSGTVGHGLGVQPQLIIGKTRNHAVDWYVQTPLLAANLTGILNTTSAWYNPGYNHWNDTHPTDTVFSVGGYMAGHADLTSPSTKICYCFANVEGHQKVGTYVGNGSADGPFVYTGFKVSFLLLKVSSAVNNWFIYDNKREGYNQENDTLSPNDASVEDNSYKLDLVSNGFKIRGSNNAHNQSGQTFIYLAFAEAPFKYANAR